MTQVFEYLQMILLFCPFLVLFISYFLLKRLKMKQVYAVGFSADLTTLLLFCSVPFIIQVTWDYSVNIIVVILAIVLALILTFIEWRTKKEIEVPKLFRKIWRVYFVSLIAIYVVVVIAALVQFLLTTTQL